MRVKAISALVEMFLALFAVKGLLIETDKTVNKIQRRALLLQLVDEVVKEIFETLADTGEGKDCELAMRALNDYFIQKVKSTHQNHMFRSLKQQDGGTLAQFITRLRQVIKNCDYGNQAENQNRDPDQVVQRFNSHELRKKVLKRR